MKTPTRIARRVWRRLDGSLRARLVVPTAIIATASAGLMVLTAAQLHNGDLRRANSDRAAIFASLATSAATAHMGTYQHADISELLGALKSHRPDVDALSIIGPDGVITATSDASLRGLRPWSAEQLGLRDPQDLATDGFVVVRPISNEANCSTCHQGAEPIAWLELRFSNQSLRASQQHLLATLALAAVPSLLLLLAVTWWLLGREAVHPIQRLVEAMRRAKSGDEGRRADEGRPDEIGVAARKFDATVDALRRSRAELARVHAQHMERADRFAMVGQMATGLAHEIKNPLAGLSGALELLAEDLAHEPHQSEVVGEMRHQVDRLSAIMDGLLHFARPPKAVFAPTDLNTSLEKVFFLIGQQRNRAGVTITRELAAGLPLVRADSSQLEQVFLNIGLNAFQVLQLGGKIAVRSFRRGDEVVVEIADDGPGIPEAIRSSIFTPFFTTRSNGTGLGLALSMRLISEHGGRLWFDCPPQGGTVFSVSLPVAVSPADGGREARSGVLTNDA